MAKYVYIQFHDGGRNNSPDSEIVSYPDSMPIHKVVEAKQREHQLFWGSLRSDACTYRALSATDLVSAIIETAD